MLPLIPLISFAGSLVPELVGLFGGRRAGEVAGKVSGDSTPAGPKFRASGRKHRYLSAPSDPRELRQGPIGLSAVLIIVSDSLGTK